ncbi:MAG: hypothetical protein V7646_6080, partial [Pseudonocardia sp.]
AQSRRRMRQAAQVVPPVVFPDGRVRQVPLATTSRSASRRTNVEAQQKAQPQTRGPLSRPQDDSDVEF